MRHIRKILQTLIYYVLPLSLVAIGVLNYINMSPRDFEHWAAELGSPAWLLFLVILYASPLATIFPQPIRKIPAAIVSLRRELGILITWLVFFHTIYLTIAVTNFDIFLIESFDPTHTLSWGWVAGIAIFIMGITSNKFSIKTLKLLWSKIHYLAYAVLITGMIHVAIAEGDYVGRIIVVLIYLGLKFTAIQIKKNRLQAPAPA